MVGRTNAVSGNQAYYLGQGTSFDVSNYTGYSGFTVDNFVVEPVGLSGSSKAVGEPGDDYDYSSTKGEASCSYSSSLVKSYNASTGAFTCSLSASGSKTTGVNPVATASGSAAISSFKVYLIRGDIKEA